MDFRTFFAAINKDQDGSTFAPRAKKVRKPHGTPKTRILISLAITLVFGLIYFYIELPAINIHATELYWFLFLLCAVFCVAMTLLSGFSPDKGTGYINNARRNMAVPFYIACAIGAVFVIGSLAGAVIFRAKAYSELLPIQNGDFAEDIAEINWEQVPMLDEDSANNLANRKLGELSDLVSQFTVSDSSAQINLHGAPVRVSYLNYDNFFKWLSNRSEGIPAYMTVDMVTQEVTVVRMEEGIKYSPSEYFGRDLYRHLRFKYPTLIFDDVNFEVDETGTPFWIATVVTKTIGLFGGTDCTGAVLVNAVTGECQYYDMESVPTWVDRVFPSDLVISQYDFYGVYHNGFWNSLFVQTDCTETTAGYNYIALDDDVWLYTGITSVSDDRGNIGFILVNQRTKEAKYYSCAGAEEFSAMDSAEGAVQQYSYDATFPLLLNVSDQPTYFMALKDAAGLVKMYALVNVQQYQIVATGSSIEACREKYHELMISGGIIKDDIGERPEAVTVTSDVTDIRSAVSGGETVYYFLLNGYEPYFTVYASDFPEAVITSVGDSVTVTYIPSEQSIIKATSFERN